jgi:hypothetical protein
MKHCIAILNKQKCLFFKNRKQEGKIVPVWRIVAVGRERILRKGVGG